MNFTDIWANAMAFVLVPSDAAIWVIATAYFFPVIPGAYFSGGFLILAFLAAIPWEGGAESSGDAAVGSPVGRRVVSRSYGAS